MTNINGLIGEIAPAATEAPADPPAATEAPAAAAPSEYSWAGEDAGYAETKGFKTAADVLSYSKTLESKLGEGAILYPDKPEELEMLYTKLGRPATADEYDFGLPEGADTSLAQSIAPELHKIGLTAAQVKQLGPTYTKLQEEAIARADNEFLASRKQDVSDLQKELGRGYETLTQSAKIAVDNYGLEDTAVLALERSIGTRKTLEFLSKLGDTVKEAPVSRVEGAAGGISIEAAKYQLQQLKKSPEFISQYSDTKAPGHLKAVERLKALQAIIYQEEE